MPTKGVVRNREHLLEHYRNFLRILSNLELRVVCSPQPDEVHQVVQVYPPVERSQRSEW